MRYVRTVGEVRHSRCGSRARILRARLPGLRNMRQHPVEFASNRHRLPSDRESRVVRCHLESERLVQLAIAEGVWTVFNVLIVENVPGSGAGIFDTSPGIRH